MPGTMEQCQPEETCVWEEKCCFPCCPTGTLQAHCCVRWVVSTGKTGQHDCIRDTALPHCLSWAPHAELPAWNKPPRIPGGTAWPVVWGGSETIHGWQGRKTISRTLGIEWKPLSCTPGTGAISQAEAVPQPASRGCVQGLRWFWDPPLTSCHQQSVGQAKLCWVLLSFMWGGTEPSLPPIYSCAFFCFTALMLYGLQEFYSPENSSSCEDATKMLQVWRYPWVELPVE